MSALYDLSTIGTVNNQLTFNDYTAHPTYRVRATTPQRRDFREQDAPIPLSPGVSDFLAYEGKSYFLISGMMYPFGEDEYYRGREKLRSIGNLEKAQADPLSDGGYVPYIWSESNRQRMIMVRVMYVDDMNESTQKGFQQPFTFVCKVKNPVIYDVSAVSTTLGINSIGTVSGTSGYPLRYPVAYGKTAYSAGGSVINAGDLSAYPSFNIYGPASKPRITNLTTGEFIEVDVNLTSATDVLSISYDNDTPPSITLNGISVYNKKTSGSTFWKVKPGQNQLQLTAATLNGGYATVSFYSTYSLS